MRTLLVVAVCAALAGCAFQRAEDAKRAQTELQGLSSEQILTCMGVPGGRLSQGETEVWVYDSGNGQQTFSATGTTYGNFGSVVGASQQRFCKVNVVTRGGSVQAVNYSGPTGGLLTEGEQCAYAVRNCVKPR